VDWLPVFKKNYLVTGLDDASVERVAALASYKAHLAGEHIMRIGDKGCDLAVVLDGRVNVLSESGEKITEVGPGSVLGEVALLDNRPRSANVIAMGLVHAAHIPAQDLRRFLSENRDIGFVVLANLCQVLCHRLRSTDLRLDHFAKEAATLDPWKHAL
jgi:CRP/FNR family cyclic AMP-dependent transcriptional regulator